MKHKVSSDETPVRAIKRAVDVLRAIGAADEGARLTDIAAAAALHKTTALRVLQTLVSEDFVGYNSHEQIYSIGPALLAVAMRGRRARDLRTVQALERLAMPPMRALRDATGETVVLVARHGDVRVNVAVLLGSYELIASPSVGAQLPLHAGGPGKILLSFLSAVELDAYIHRSNLVSVTPNTISSATELKKELRHVQTVGYATSSSEATEGQESIAAPLVQRGIAIAAINLIVPTVRMNDRRRKELIPRVRSTAAGISQLMDASPEQNAE
jgi:IclR family pca regulon transcriptional regulator